MGPRRRPSATKRWDRLDEVHLVLAHRGRVVGRVGFDQETRTLRAGRTLMAKLGARDNRGVGQEPQEAGGVRLKRGGSR